MKKRILALLLTTILILSVPAFAAEKITVYAPDGRTATIYTYQLQSWKNVGWYDYPVTRMYALDGRTAVISSAKVWDWKNVGWYDYPVVKVYAPDGRTSVISKNALQSWKNVGWYEYPVTRMYALDGRTAVINSNQVQSWINVGWYTEPMAKLYSLDGRTLVVPLDQVDVHTRVGWLTLNRFLFEASLAQLENVIDMQYDSYYAGVDQSGDIPRTYYRNASGYPYSYVLVSYGIAPYDSCVFTSMKLGEAFPYLKLYADKNGYIEPRDINNAFDDYGIYGTNYRDNPTYIDYGSRSFSYLHYWSQYGYYMLTYDYMQGLITCDDYGRINVNTSNINFWTLQ